MPGSRTLAALALASVVALGACGDDDDDDDGFFTAPDPPPGPGGPTADAQCEDDDRAPEITLLRAKPDGLWPPNHDMKRVEVVARADDSCKPLSIAIAGVSSNEPVNGAGDGNTTPDWEVTGPLTLRLRAERSGDGDGRLYTIRVRFADGIGNERFGSATVLVPHDKGDGRD